MSMALADLIADHKLQLGEAVRKRLGEADAVYQRQLLAATLALNEKRPRRASASLSLVAEQARYTAPSDALAVLRLDWGADRRFRQPWQQGYIGVLPVCTLDGDQILLSPAPSADQIACLGASAGLRYLAAHSLDADAENTTVPATDRAVLLLAALIEAMRELASANVAEPITLHRGIGNTPSNATPAAWYQALRDEWQALR